MWIKSLIFATALTAIPLGQTLAADETKESEKSVPSGESEAKSTQADKGEMVPQTNVPFSFCTNRKGMQIETHNTTGIIYVAQARKARRSRRYVMYNPEVLPQAPAEVRLFLFARECASFATDVGIPLEATPEDNRRLDCWGAKKLHLEGFLTDAQVDGVDQYLNELSAAHWVYLSGGKREIDLMSCLAEPLEMPSSKAQVAATAEASKPAPVAKEPECKNKKVVRTQVGVKKVASLQAPQGGNQAIHPLLYFVPAPPKQTTKDVPIYEYTYECVDEGTKEPKK